MLLRAAARPPFMPLLRFSLGVLAALLASGSAAAQPFDAMTSRVGLGGVVSANGLAVADYDRDGDLDVYVVASGSYDSNDPRTWNRLYEATGAGAFTIVTRDVGVRGRDAGTIEATGGQGFKVGAAWGDYDNDGWPDLYLTHAGPNQLLRNNGDGTFADVTAEAGVAGGPTQFSTSPLWVDVDADGDLDLYVSVWDDYADGERDLTNPLFRNRGDGTFETVTDAAGVARGGKTYTTVPVDVDADGDLDLYHANDFGANTLSLNLGDGTFREAAAEFGLADPAHGMGLAVGDADGDGRLDLYLTNIADGSYPGETHGLFMAAESGFTNEAVAAGVGTAGWGWGTAFFDLENDGDEDLYVGAGNVDLDTPNALFENRSDGTLRFAEVGEARAVNSRFPARSVVPFDYDDDGRLDLLISSFLSTNAQAILLYRNPPGEGRWLKVALEGTASNRDGLGAVVEVEADGRRWVRSHHGAGFLSQSLLPVHVGLGEAETVDRVTVRWPSGLVEDATGLAVDQSIRFREGDGLVEGVAVASEAPSEAAPRLRLLGAAPNPTAGSVTIRFETATAGRAELQVFDRLGRLVHTARQSVPAGPSSLTWDARGTPVVAGLYVYVLTVDDARATGRIAVAR